MVNTDIIDLLAAVKDPELPMISIFDLGILRRVLQQNGRWQVIITPTFSGCPAINEIERNIHTVLTQGNVGEFDIVKELSPPWRSTDVSASGRKLLHENGIAFADDGVRCPRCDSTNTLGISDYGATACKSFARCLSCKEPFEVFKAH
ncbi:MAG: phenylacetate-CoA oxygenase subunit PaaJ [Proteobacteria bacterium]|nr:phenylacetate-CoA oxygenase subunit PaaJ [Pseudomonadota bacterium]